FPRIGYAVEGLIMQHLVNLLYANGGMGKTTVAIQIGTAVAYGRTIFGRAVQQAPVLVVTAEDDNGETKGRVGAALRHLQVEDAEKAKLKLWCLPGHDISLARVDENGKAMMLPFYKALEAHLKENPGTFVVLDSLVDIAQMAEKDRLAPNTFFKKVL